MSDEDHRHDRSEEASPGHDHPEGESPESQRRSYTPVRLAGFPAPPVAQQPPPDDDTSEDESRDHTGDDLSNEPANSPVEEHSEGEFYDETGSDRPENEKRAGGDGERSESQYRSSPGQQQANTGARGSGARLVVPASGGKDGAEAPQQQEHQPQQPAVEDASGSACNAPAPGDEVHRDEVRAEEQAHTTPEPTEPADGQDRADPPSQADKTISGNSPAAGDDAPRPTVSETSSAAKHKEERRSRRSGAQRQAIADSDVRLEPPEDPPERGQVAPATGERGRSLTTGETRTETEPSRRQRTSRARGYSILPWRALAMVAAVILALGAGAAGAYALWPSPEQPGSDAVNRSQPQDGAANGDQVGGSELAGIRNTGVRDTGVSFEELSVEGAEGNSSGDGDSGSGGEDDSESVDVSLRAAVAGGEEMVWTGTASGPYEEGENSLKQSPQAARSISLSGEGSPTSANFQAGFAMPTAPGGGGDGEIQSGVMARTEAGEPVTHATYQRLAPAGGASEGESVHAQGSYYIADDEGVIAEGTYTDRREDGSEDVVRTYTEDNAANGGERAYRVSFEAPANTPIPTLVGWQPPEDEG